MRNDQTKKEILLALGSNHAIKDGELAIGTHKWLQPIEKRYKNLEKKYVEVRKSKSMTNKQKKEPFRISVSPGGRF